MWNSDSPPPLLHTPAYHTQNVTYRSLCHVRPLLKISWKSVHVGCTDMNPPPPMNFPQKINRVSNVSKFHENQFICFSMIMRTETDTPSKYRKKILCPKGLTQHPQNVYHFRTNLQILWKSVHSLFRNMKHGFSPNNSVHKGLNAVSPKCPQLWRVSFPTYPANCTEIRPSPFL